MFSLKILSFSVIIGTIIVPHTNASSIILPNETLETPLKTQSQSPCLDPDLDAQSLNNSTPKDNPDEITPSETLDTPQLGISKKKEGSEDCWPLPFHYFYMPIGC